MAASSSYSDIITLRSRIGDEIKISKSLLLEKSHYFKEVLQRTRLKPIQALLIEENTENLLKMKRYLKENYLKINSLNEATNIYNMAKSFQMKDLLIICRNYIIREINPITVCGIYDFSSFQQDRFIQYHCWIEFDKKWDEIIRSPEFSQSEMTTVKTFVSRPKHTDSNEFNLFKAVRTWAVTKFLSTQCTIPDFNIYLRKVREYMMPFLNKIRFLSMSREELEHVFYSRVLTNEEREAISSYDNYGNLENLPDSICKTRVKRTEQCYGRLIEYKYRHNPHIQINKNVTADTKFRCRFTPKADCFLYSIIMPILTKEKVLVKLKIIIRNKILFYHANYYCDESQCIDIPEPLFLQENIEYFVIGNIVAESVSSEIKIEENSEFYIHDHHLKQLQEFQKENPLEWNKYFIKIRLYF